MDPGDAADEPVDAASSPFCWLADGEDELDATRLGGRALLAAD